MRPEFEEALSKSIDDAVVFVGAKDYPDAIETLARALHKMQECLNAVRTKELFIDVLRQAGDVPLEQEMYVVGLIQGLPGIIRMLLTEKAPELAKDLPPLPTGRKQSLTLEQRVQICNYVSELYRKGVQMQVAKQLAAQKFGVKLRSVERAWSKRSNYNLEKPDIPTDELMRWMTTES